MSSNYNRESHTIASVPEEKKNIIQWQSISRNAITIHRSIAARPEVSLPVNTHGLLIQSVPGCTEGGAFFSPFKIQVVQNSYHTVYRLPRFSSTMTSAIQVFRIPTDSETARKTQESTLAFTVTGLGPNREKFAPRQKSQPKNTEAPHRLLRTSSLSA